MSLASRLSLLAQAIGGDIKNHNSRLTALEAQTGFILDEQYKQGAGSGYVVLASGGTLQTGGASSSPMSLTYTPPVNCWWETSGLVGILDKTDAAYHYAYIYLTLSPNDVDGNNAVYQIFTQNQASDRYGNRMPSRIWKLNAGTAYTVTMAINTSGGTWQYTQLAQYLKLQGKAWSR